MPKTASKFSSKYRARLDNPQNKAKPSWFTAYCPRLHVFLSTEQYFHNLFNNHFLGSVYVWAVFTAEITVWGTNGMIQFNLIQFDLIIQNRQQAFRSFYKASENAQTR